MEGVQDVFCLFQDL